MASHRFHPDVGGIEKVSETLALEFQRESHEVRVVTQSQGQLGGYPYEVVRKPGSRSWMSLLRWCDVYLQNNISLKGLWPLAAVKKPWVVSHHTWITRTDGRIGVRDRLKLFTLRMARNISVSNSIASALPVPSVVIGNPYASNQFKLLKTVPRNKELIFVGRLVSDKGVDDLLHVLSVLKKREITPGLTIIGDGPERAPLELLTKELGLVSQVEFAGVKSGENLTELLNQHQIMVVPSRWKEPFGVVALEGIACGCVIVGSSGGGLADAIGNCGLIYSNGSREELAACLEKVLKQPDLRAGFCSAGPEHLSHFAPNTVARAYLSELEKAAS